MSAPELPGEWERLEIAALRGRVDELAGRVDVLEGIEDPPGREYRPIPAPRWWRLAGTERDEAADRLDRWVEKVYRPSCGKPAERLPSCWREHPFCLAILDWLSELHSVLYLQPGRTPGTLAGQAEWTTRLLPAAADLLAAEARGCSHRGER